MTSISATKYMNDQGIIVIEDVHSSYSEDFGKSNKYSFSNWIDQLGEGLNSVYLNKQYFLSSNQNNLLKKLSHISKYRSLTALHMKNINEIPKGIFNTNSSENIVDFRYENYSKCFKTLRKLAIFRPINIISVGNRRFYLRFMNKFINLSTLKLLNYFYSLVIIFV